MLPGRASTTFSILIEPKSVTFGRALPDGNPVVFSTL